MPGRDPTVEDGSRLGDPVGEIYLEMRVVGKAQRITAVDPETALEVIFTAPVHTPRVEIETIARNKLSARVKRERAKAVNVPGTMTTERGRLV